MADLAASKLFLTSPSDAPALRVGLLVVAEELPVVARSILEDLQRCAFVKIVLIAKAARWASTHLGHSRSGFFCDAYLKYEASRYSSPEDPLIAEDCATLLQSLGAARVDLSSASPAAGLTTEDRQGIVSCDLDVLLDLTSCGMRWSVGGATRYGMWRFSYGDSRFRHGGPAYLRESLSMRPLSAIELVSVGAADAEDGVLCRAEFSTSPYPSASINRTAPIWGAQHFMIQKLWELHQFGPDFLSRKSLAGHSTIDSTPGNAPPGNVEIARWILKQAGRRVWNRLRRQGQQVHWRIAVRKSAVPLFEQPGLSTLRQFRWLESPPGHFWADPFLVEWQGKTWVFFEDMDHAVGRAHISCGLLSPDGSLTEVQDVLRCPYHLSYPQIVVANDSIYMLPEASAGGGLDLYRAVEFPRKWVLETRLLDFKCVDSTLFFEAGRWWLITSPMVVDGHAAVSWLFSADEIQGPWRYCPSGPVALDVSMARGAGSVFRLGRKLIRPSQDCSGGYGRALLFNEIETLESGAYREQTIVRIDGGWLPGLAGVHTYNRAGEWEVIDGQFLGSRAPRIPA